MAVALTIAGSDSGGGAGIQADLKTFSAFGQFGCSVITAVTAQNTHSVTAVHPIPNEMIRAQIDAVLSDIQVDAIKIGMLGDPTLIESVAASLENFDGPIVLDPVMVAKSGAVLVGDEALSALRDYLLPKATLLTPNIPEAAKLLCREEVFDTQGLKEQGHALLNLGAEAVLMKGGHGLDDICTDWMLTPDNALKLDANRIPTKNTHGTGCTYSSAIAAGLADGQDLETSVRKAHEWLHEAIKRSDDLDVGQGHGPVHHFHRMWP